ncbi:MAG: hypothetical protein ACLTTU_03000 [Bilophila wadsworthia]
MCTCVIPRAPPCSTRWISGPGASSSPTQSVEEARRLVEYAKYYLWEARIRFFAECEIRVPAELKQIGDYFTATNQRTILMPQCEQPERWNILRRSPLWTASTAFCRAV